MVDVVELERRITAALDRIQYSAGRIAMASAAKPAGFPPAATGDGPAHPDSSWQTARIAQLEAQLSEEKTVTAQLEERVRVLKERGEGVSPAALEAARSEGFSAGQAEAEGAMGANIEKARAKLAGYEAEMENLRRANADLREMTARLRSAMEAGVATPELINRATQAELDALRATRAADAAELDAVIEELRPLIEEAN